MAVLPAAGAEVNDVRYLDLANLVLAILAACAVDESTGGDRRAAGVVFGVAEGVCPLGLEVEVDVGSDVAIVSGGACPADGSRCEPITLRRVEPGSSFWRGSCDEGWLYSIAWVVPA